MKDHFRGVIQTIWSGSDDFLDRFYGRKSDKNEKSEVSCFKALFDEVQKN
jgi:hypothetical protein